MTATREIAGLEFTCEKMAGTAAIPLFLRTSSGLRSARGLFMAIAGDALEAEMIHEFFEFTREMDPAVVGPLVMDLAALPKRTDGQPTPPDLHIEDILELAFFGTAVNFGALLPAGIDPLLRRAWARQEAGAVAEADGTGEAAR